MKKRQLRERITELEREVKRLEAELQAHSMRTARLTPPVAAPIWPGRAPWQGDMVPWTDGETAYPYPSLPGMTTTNPGDVITWIQPHTTGGSIHIYSDGEAK